MLDFGFYNEDCLPRMKEYPDNYFNLAIVDPPYGDAQGGDGGGDLENDSESINSSTGGITESTNTETWNRFGGWFNRYKRPF